MKTSRMKWLLATALTPIAVGGSVAYARSMCASLGQPQNPSDYSSFSNTDGTIKNTSAVTKRYCVTLPVDSSGTKTVDVMAKGTDTNHNVGCFAKGLHATGYVWSSSTQKFLVSFNISQYIEVQTSVPSSGALLVCCDIGPGSQAEIAQVNYNE